MVAFTVGLVVAATGTAFAANGNCPNGLPFCFAPNSPARSSEVNHNFMQLKEWLETKVGTATVAGVQTSTVTATGNVSSAGTVTGQSLTVNGGGLIGNNSAGNFHIDPSGQRLYLNWYGGNDGIVFGNGAQAQMARLTSGGALSVNGGLSGAGRLCFNHFDCLEENPFSCGQAGACSQGRVMIGYRDGTSCGVNNTAICCKLQLSTNCP